MQKLTQIEIPLHTTNQTSVTFLLLQTHLQQDPTSIHNHQLNTLLYQLYNQVEQIVSEQVQSKENSANMLKECSEIVKGFKENQDALFSVSQDRLRLVKELKEATDQALELMDQNEKYKQIIASMQKLNDALTARHHQTQKQLDKLSQGTNIKASIQGLSKDYDSMMTANTDMQKEMIELSLLAAKFQKLSLPIRVIKVAFNSNNNLRELVMKQAEKELGNSQQLRDIFFGCQFELGQASA